MYYYWIKHTLFVIQNSTIRKKNKFIYIYVHFLLLYVWKENGIEYFQKRNIRV